jgi:hypothetical protein
MRSYAEFCSTSIPAATHLSPIKLALRMCRFSTRAGFLVDSFAPAQVKLKDVLFEEDAAENP